MSDEQVRAIDRQAIDDLFPRVKAQPGGLPAGDPCNGHG